MDDIPACLKRVSSLSIDILSFFKFFKFLMLMLPHSITATYLNFNMGIMFQFLLIGIMIIAIMTYTKKSCFKEIVKGDKIKEFFKLCVIGCLWMCIMVACVMFLDKLLVFRLNIILVLIVGIALYFIGHYVSEK